MPVKLTNVHTQLHILYDYDRSSMGELLLTIRHSQFLVSTKWNTPLHIFHIIQHKRMWVTVKLPSVGEFRCCMTEIQFPLKWKRSNDVSTSVNNTREQDFQTELSSSHLAVSQQW